MPKGRPRFSRRTGRARTPKKTAQWERKARGVLSAAYTLQEPLNEPLKVYVLSVKPRPQNVSRKCDPEGLVWCPKMPDGDNVMKAALDAAVKAGLMTDDNIVVRWNCDTVWAEKGVQPRVELTLYTLTRDP